MIKLVCREGCNIHRKGQMPWYMGVAYTRIVGPEKFERPVLILMPFHIPVAIVAGVIVSTVLIGRALRRLGQKIRVDVG